MINYDDGRCGPGMCHWQFLKDLQAALRRAFPHFQSDEPITPDAIKAIGREYEQMVMGWAPVPKEIEFVDMIGHPGKLHEEDGLWCFNGILPLHTAPSSTNDKVT